MTQQTPNNNITSATAHESHEIPGVAINNNTGTVNVYLGEQSPIQGFIAPDIASDKLAMQVREMQNLGLITDQTMMAMHNAANDANIAMPPVQSTVVGKHTQQLQNQAEALSQAPNGHTH